MKTIIYTILGSIGATICFIGVVYLFRLNVELAHLLNIFESENIKDDFMFGLFATLIQIGSGVMSYEIIREKNLS